MRTLLEKFGIIKKTYYYKYQVANGKKYQGFASRYSFSPYCKIKATSLSEAKFKVRQKLGPGVFFEIKE